MRGIFNDTQAINNDEYRLVLARKRSFYVVVIMLGLFTLTLPMLINQGNDHIHSIFSGIGVGMIAAGCILILKIQHTLRDEKRLKADRLNNTDERLVEIAQRAFITASIVMLCSLYISAIIGCLLIDERLIFFMLINVIVLLMSYLIAYNYFKRKI